MMVIFLCGLVALILLRTLRNDYQKYSAEAEEMDLERVVDEGGWKQVHGDVFRAPPHLMWFSALVGTGAQLVTLVVAVLVFALTHDLYISYACLTFLPSCLPVGLSCLVALPSASVFLALTTSIFLFVFAPFGYCVSGSIWCWFLCRCGQTRGHLDRCDGVLRLDSLCGGLFFCVVLQALRW
jgi:hypothetical protein